MELREAAPHQRLDAQVLPARAVEDHRRGQPEPRLEPRRRGGHHAPELELLRGRERVAEDGDEDGADLVEAAAAGAARHLGVLPREEAW